MIKAIGNQAVELNKDEWEYYKELEKKFGEDDFIGLFSSNSEGMITAITPSPSKPTAMVLVFFFLNLMLNQKLRNFDQTIKKFRDLEDRLVQIEEKLK